MQESASVMNADRRDAEILGRAPEGQPQDGRRRGPMKFAYASGSKPLEGYTIKRGIGAGGFGDVYYATSDAGKDVALKRIQRNLDVELRGVSQCLNLKHPNLLSLYDIRYDDQDQAWVVMEYMAGDSLQDVIERNPNGLELEQLMAWFEGIVKGVAYLHDHGIVHRDLKPGNIFMDHAAVKIGDYGLSKFISCSRRSGQTESVGTFHYMAPEIGLGRYGKEIDIYALGILLFEMLTGRVPFEGESSQEIIMKHLTAQPDLNRVPPAFRGVIARAMAKDPTERFRSAQELLNALHGKPVAAAAAAAATAAAAGLGAAGGPTSAVGAKLKQVYYQSPPPIRTAGAATARAAHNAAASANVHLRQDREPIAMAVGGALSSAQGRVRNMPVGHQILVNVIVFIVLVVNAAWLLPLAIMGGALYAVYYVLWYIMFRIVPAPRQAGLEEPFRYANPAAVAGLADTVAPPRVAPQPVAPAAAAAVHQPPTMPPSRPIPKRRAGRPAVTKQQVVDKMRAALENKGFFQRSSELTGSMLMAAVVAVVLSTVFGVMGSQSELFNGDVAWNSSVFAWNAIVTVLGSWAILFFGKLWEHSDGDQALRRFSLMVVGMALGGVAWGLADFLMVEPVYLMPARGWATVKDAVFVQSMPSLYQADGAPHPMAYAGYFGGLFLTLRWWLFADPLRSRRFSVVSSAVTIGMAMLMYAFLPVPRGAMVMVTMVVAVQLSATWVNQRRRREFKAQLEAAAAAA